MNKVYYLYFALSLLAVSLNNGVNAQSRIDSIEAEIELLNKQYNEQLTALYHEMLEISYDKNNSVVQRLRAMTMFYLFPIDENANRLIDSLDHEMFSYERGFTEEYPYFHSLSKLVYDGALYHIKLLEKLEASLNDDEFFLYSIIINSSKF